MLPGDHNQNKLSHVLILANIIDVWLEEYVNLIKINKVCTHYDRYNLIHEIFRCLVYIGVLNYKIILYMSTFVLTV